MKKMTVTLTQEPCSVDHFLDLATKGAGHTAWVLFETVKKAGLIRLSAAKVQSLAADASRLIIFSPDSEYRMEKASFAQQGVMRVVQTGGPQGLECRVREQQYILRPNAGVRGSLVCREFFCPDESGMLNLHCECLVSICEEEQ